MYCYYKLPLKQFYNNFLQNTNYNHLLYLNLDSQQLLNFLCLWNITNLFMHFSPFTGVIPHIHKSLIGKKGQQKAA